MRIQICSCQAPETLEEHYAKFAAQGHLRCRQMLPVLELLSQAPDRPGVFGLTSHESLCLLSEDNYDTPWWVIITPTPPRTFQVEYRPHEAVPPWKDAYVKVLARTPKEAVEQALFGMERSRAWTEGGGIGGEL